MDAPLRAGVRGALRSARLYFVCDAAPRGGGLESVLRQALRGGVDVIQLRDKALHEGGLIEAAATFRALAREFEVPFLINDRADLVAACGADGVHVGQDDVSVATARELAGAEAIVGLSTHSAEQLDAACATTGAQRPDYVSVGPVWPTPTKEGRPATGVEYVQIAAQAASLPWFAIGGIDAANVNEVIVAGARSIVVVRAIRDAPNVEAAARALRSALGPRHKPGASSEADDSANSARTGQNDDGGVAAALPPRDR